MAAPFPYFGGKSLIAGEVWRIFGGDARNYVEPFAGSLAVLLARPTPFNGPETINDYSCHVVNFWRAIVKDPAGLAALCVAPVAEVNTEAQHAYICRRADELRDALGDPHYYDIEMAAYWVKGCNEWIGSGWASGEGPWQWSRESGWYKIGDTGAGVKRQLPHLGNTGTGVNRQLPHLGNTGTGVNRQLPHLGDTGKGEYGRRVAALCNWFYALRDRLCCVRITCGDWERLASSDSSTTKHGTTAYFLDPPYSGTEYVYGNGESVSHRVNEWCAKNGKDKDKRIVLCGRGEEHDNLIEAGFRRVEWKTRKGYGNDSAEVIWHNCAAASQQGQFDL